MCSTTLALNCKGYPGSRTFGGDAYWVAQMGKAYIAGVHEGSEGRVATVAKHFPGQGASDRRPDREVATVQKPLSALQQVELVPFRAVTEDAATAPRTTDAMMTSHVRYKGFQENPRQLTPPISLAPELQTIMERIRQLALAMAACWSPMPWACARSNATIRPTNPDDFPTRRVTQEAFLAGNDLLVLSQFDRDGIWSAQFANMTDAITFFRQKYQEDPAFRATGGSIPGPHHQAQTSTQPATQLGRHPALSRQLWRNSIRAPMLSPRFTRCASTLIFPGATEMADRLPSPPAPRRTRPHFHRHPPRRGLPHLPQHPRHPRRRPGADRHAALWSHRQRSGQSAN